MTRCDVSLVLFDVFSRAVPSRLLCEASEPLLTILLYAGGTFLVIRTPDQSEVAEASEALRLPSAKDFINAGVTCESSPPPCSDGSWCLDGDLGVYCQRYLLRSSSEEVRAQRKLGKAKLDMASSCRLPPPPQKKNLNRLDFGLDAGRRLVLALLSEW